MKCKECTDRVVGCHSTCESYKTYKEEMASLTKARKDDLLPDTTIAYHTKERKINWKRRHEK